MAKKILVTHVNPHLDDIMALWLFVKFAPDCKNAGIEFISQNKGKTFNGKPVDSDLNIIHIGVARGKFDEHRGLPNECAASLVFAFLKENKFLPKNKIKRKALEKFIKYIREEDSDKTYPKFFELPPIIDGFNTLFKNSLKTSKLVFKIIKALLISLENKIKLEKDWKHKIEFKTRWGKAVALETQSRIGNFAFQKGFILTLNIDPVNNWRGIEARMNSSIDLTSLYKKIKKIDSKADWYLHHSKKKLLNGLSVAPDATPSKLTREEIIQILKCL